MPPLRLKEDRGRGEKGRMGWRGDKEGGPHEMRPLPKTKSKDYNDKRQRRWIPQRQARQPHPCPPA